MNISPIGTAPMPDPTSSVFTNIQRLFDILNLPPDRLGVSLNLVQFSALPPPVLTHLLSSMNEIMGSSLFIHFHVEFKKSIEKWKTTFWENPREKFLDSDFFRVHVNDEYDLLLTQMAAINSNLPRKSSRPGGEGNV